MDAPATDTGTDVSLPLRVTRFSRTVALARALVPLLLAITIVVVAVDEWNDDDVKPPDRAGIIITVGLGGGLCGWLGIRFLRPAVVTGAQLRLEPDALVVHHRGLFKEPLRVPRAAIRCAATDDRPAPWRWFKDHQRFHVAGSEGLEEAPEWLWSRTADCPIPLMSHVGDVPNVAFVFSTPVQMRETRRAMKPFALRGPVHIPHRGQRARGLVARLADGASPDAIGRWTVVRPLTASDLASVAPEPDERKGARKKRIRANILLFVIVAVQSLPGFFADSNGA